MEKNNLTKGLLAALLLASPMVGAEPQYPQDVEPVVIYRDDAYIAKHSQPAQAAPAEQAKTEQARPDPGYVAAKSAESTPPAAAPTVTEKAKPAVVQATPVTPTAQPQESPQKESSMSIEVILVILAVAGFVFWNFKRSGSKPSTSPAPAGVVKKEAPAIAAGASGETGVARYVTKLNVSSGKTGVSKYLKANLGISAEETGVAKYLENLNMSSKLAEAIKPDETGVDKYLKSVEVATRISAISTGVDRYLQNLEAR